MRFKKAIISLILIVSISSGLLISNPVYSSSKTFVEIQSDTLNVRSGPSLDYKITEKVYKGERYELLEEKNNWVKIKTKNSEGWIAGWFTKKITDSTTIQKTAEATVENLNVRSGPSTSFAIIGQIHPEQKYPILEQQGEWVKIQLNSSKSGWVATWFVKISEGTPSEESLQQDYVTIETDDLNVRSGPSTNSDIIGELNKGEKVEVLEVIDGWYKIKYKNGFGWIASKYASQVNEQDKDNTTNDNNNQTKPTQKKQVIVNVDSLNMRSGPGQEYEIIAKLNKGSILTVEETSGDWLKVSTNMSPSKQGWVANWLVSDYNQIVSNQPMVTILYPATNLRESPSTSAPVVARANAGEQFPIISTVGDWYQIQLNDGRKAYVAGWIVSTKGVEQKISKGIDKVLKDKVIVIDAGHGGRDNGATGLHFKSVEKDLNLQIAKLLQQKLEAAGSKVIMTRTTDEKIQLQERVDIAINNDADAFISIHHNTNADTHINGTITYYYDSYDRELAKELQSELVKHIETKDLNARYGDYFILRENTQVAVLIETAFISNYHDELKAKSPKFQENVAEGIFQGIIKYFAKK